MIIVKIQGGLGNQMFQYALYRSLLERGKNSKMDIRVYRNSDFHYGYELAKIFNIKEIYATNKECMKIGNDVYGYWKLRKKLMGRTIPNNSSHIIQNNLPGANSFSYIKTIFDMDEVYLDGFWQNENYFKGIASVLHHDFTFKHQIDDRNKEILKNIQETNSVSIHIRRGDYLQHSHFSEAFNMKYYFNAIDYIKSKLVQPVFFIFSDDMEWCRLNLNIENSIYIDVNSGKKSFNDLNLMRHCKHNIIANSSFSWWGAWLNTNENKIVIAPKRWAIGYSEELGSIVPDRWIKL